MHKTTSTKKMMIGSISVSVSQVDRAFESRIQKGVSGSSPRGEANRNAPKELPDPAGVVLVVRLDNRTVIKLTSRGDTTAREKLERLLVKKPKAQVIKKIWVSPVQKTGGKKKVVK